MLFARLSAQSAQLPDPRVSRPPVMTEVPADTRRTMAAQFNLSILLAALQQGDVATINALARDVSWGPTDEVTRQSGGCSSLGDAVTTLKSRSGPDSPRILFDLRSSRDSSEAIVLSGLLVVGIKGSSKVQSAQLVLDPNRMQWSRIDGFLTAFCSFERPLWRSK